MRRAGKAAQQREQERDDGQRVAYLARERRPGNRRDRDVHPARQLTAEVSGAGADDCLADPFFQHANQREGQRQMHDERIELLGRGDAEYQPARRLNEQKQRRKRDENAFLPRRAAAARNRHAEDKAVDEHQTVVKHAKGGKQRHSPASPSENSRFMYSFCTCG